MSRKYKFRDSNKPYFISFAIVNRIDVLTRKEYKDIIVDSLNYCVMEKGLNIYAWVIMTNHVHAIIQTDEEKPENILRDLKKYTSKAIIRALEDNTKESRKECLPAGKAGILWMLKRAGEKNSNNKTYQFWQQHNQPIVITNPVAFEKCLNYIHNNPVEAGFVYNPEEYPYSSAIDYSGSKGYVNIIMEE